MATLGAAKKEMCLYVVTIKRSSVDVYEFEGADLPYYSETTRKLIGSRGMGIEFLITSCWRYPAVFIMIPMLRSL
jgi:hypothetical protein